jgi:hypothetical protein
MKRRQSERAFKVVAQLCRNDHAVLDCEDGDHQQSHGPEDASHVVGCCRRGCVRCARHRRKLLYFTEHESDR